ncbi:MAG: hypothetical protein E7596_05420 [Ruminococcaceae bacterium]|nr:hypothetical protein [Oscillospiraceae bacterium]
MENKKLTDRKIPDFFAVNQKKVKNLEDWENIRPIIKEQLLKEEYGFLPEKLTPKITTEKQWVDFAGKAEWESVFFTFEKGGKTHTVRTELVLPKGKTNVPVFLSLNFQREVPNKYLPMEEIIDTGFGVFAFCYENVTEDNGDFENGLCALFERESADAFGKISIWAYFASICMDYLCTRAEVDRDNVAIIGHSRLGKTALLCSALDGRFKLTCSNDSGCCGAAISRGKCKENETFEDIVRVFPFWFCKDFAKYVNNESALPFDQHMLLALIAPRYLIIGGAREDVWADNEGQQLSCQLAGKAWGFYGEDPSKMVKYYEREGTHFLSRADWNIYMSYFKEILSRKD